MKKTFIFLLAVLGLTFYKAQTIVWTGTASTDFFDPNNWVGGIGYSGGEDILFNSGSNNCDITADISVGSFSVMSGYSGIIDLGSDDHVISNDFVINSGTVIGTSGALTMSGNGSFELGAGGTYSTTGGVVEINSLTLETFDFIGNITLNSLDLLATSNGTRTIHFGTNLTVDDISITTVNTSRHYSFQGTIHIKNSLSVNGSSPATIITNNTANLIFDGPDAVIFGPSQAGRIPLPNITMNTPGTIDMSGHINVQGNWTHIDGTLIGGGGSTVNMYGTSATITGNARFNNLTIQTGANVSTQANTEIRIGGTLTHTAGTLNMPTSGSLGFDGSGTQSLSGPAMTISGLNVYDAGSGRTVTMNTPVIVLDSVHVEDNCNLNSNGNITLRSTNALTARVGQLVGSAQVSGNVVVETTIPGNFTGWNNLGVRGVANQPVSSWDTYVSSNGANGIPMTCDGCFYDVTSIGSYFESIQGWDESASSYDTTLTASSILTPGRGYWVYVGSGQFNTTDLLLRNIGQLVQGTVNVPLTNSGYILVSNPYPSPISASKLVSESVFNSIIMSGLEIHVWNPDLNGGNGDFTTWNGTISNPGGSGSITDVIPGGQGFFVPNTTGLAFDFEFTESMKVTDNTNSSPLLRSAATNNYQMFRLGLHGASGDWDATTFFFHPEATPGVGKHDARKMFSTPGYAGYGKTYDVYTTISSLDATGQAYAINGLPPLTQSLSVPVLAKVMSTGTYTISAYDFKDFGTCVMLHDKLTNTTHDLLNGPYVCTISDTLSTPRFELLLCRDENLSTVGIEEVKAEPLVTIGQDKNSAFVAYKLDKNEKATISAYNIVGQKLMNDVEITGTGEATIERLNLNVHNQVVIIKVAGDKVLTTKKIVTN